MADFIEIGGAKVGRSERTLLVGEIGINHNGDVALARRLIESAADLGLDAVKFQSFAADRLLVESEGAGAGAAGGVDKQQMDYARSLELGPSVMSDLKKHAEDRGLLFLSTPCDPDSARELGEMGVKAVKVASMDQVDALVLKAVARMGVPVIASTGMSTLEEIRRAVSMLEEEGAVDIALLHCVAVYPAPMASLNLRFIGRLYDEFSMPVGFSDHTAGVEAAPLAVAAGACIIEKHFTLDRDMEGPDHKASLDPEGMKALVESVRAAEIALGKGDRVLSAEEKANAAAMRKSLVFSRDLRAGARLAMDDIAARRPACGVSPMSYGDFLGRALVRDVRKNERLEERQFEPLQ